MNRETKLIFALMQVENISNLISEGPYAGFFSSHLLPIKYEIERQLSCLTNDHNQSKMKES